MRNQYKPLQEVYKQILENSSDTNVDSIKNRMIAGEKVIEQLNKTPSVIAIFHLDHSGEFIKVEDFIRTPQLLPPTAVPISKSTWYDSNQKPPPNYRNIWIEIHITNTSREAIEFVKAWTTPIFDFGETRRVEKFMDGVYKALGIDGYADPILPPKNWLKGAIKRHQALNKDNPGIEMDI